MEMSLILQDNERERKTHFHMKGCTPRLVLKQKLKATRKWPITHVSIMTLPNAKMMSHIQNAAILDFKKKELNKSGKHQN